MTTCTYLVHNETTRQDSNGHYLAFLMRPLLMCLTSPFLMELHSISNVTACTYLVHNETTRQISNGTCLAFLMRLGDHYTRFLMGLYRFVMRHF